VVSRITTGSWSSRSASRTAAPRPLHSATVALAQKTHVITTTSERKTAPGRDEPVAPSAVRKLGAPGQRAAYSATTTPAAISPGVRTP
jgi:hypothetical protein